MTTKSVHSKRWFALDFETSDVNPYSCEIAGLGICEFNIKNGKILSTGYEQWVNPPIAKIREICKHNTVMHNAVFDLQLLRREGIYPTGPVYDTYLMAKHINNVWPNYGLKFLSWHFFGETYIPLLRLKEWFRTKKMSTEEDYMNLTLPPVKLVSAYCIRDVEMTAKLAHLFWPDVKDNYAHKLDTKTIVRTIETQEHGMYADLKFCKSYVNRRNRREKYNRTKAAAHMGITGNPMGNALKKHVEALGEEQVTPTGQVMTSEPVLREYKHDKAAQSAVRVRKDTTSTSKYPAHVLEVATPLEDPNYGRFHINLIQSGAVTRRYRAAGFLGENGIVTRGNPHNWSRADKSDMRKAIVAPPGYLFRKNDLASIEARMFSSFMEILMGESVFADLYRKQKDFSPYLWVLEHCTSEGKVSKKHPLYTPFKHGTLGRLYCSGPARFSKQLKDDFDLDYSEDDCREIYKDIDRAAPFIKKFQRFLLRLSESEGQLVDPFGAVYCLPTKNYEIIAHLHQGAANNVLKFWWEEFHQDMADAGDFVMNTVHDEFDVALVDDGKADVRNQGYCDVLDKLDLFDIPIKAEIDKGDTWYHCG